MLVEPRAGENLYFFIERVKKELAARHKSETEVKFNDVALRIYVDSNEYDIGEKYDLLRVIERLKEKL